MHELVEFLNQHDVVKAIGLSLLHSLWQGAIIAALLWGLLKISTQLSARIRYCFALTALGSLLICFAITLSIQFNTLDKAGSMVEETTSFIIMTDQSNAATTTETNLFQALDKGWNKLLFQARQYAGYFFLAWTIGFVLFSFRFFTGLYYLRGLKQESSPLPKNWTKKVNRLKQKLGLNKKVLLLASSRASTPLTFGWLRPVIIFPLSMVSLLPDEQVESILLHELAHIRRNDYLLHLLQAIIETIFFFNPAYWYLSKVLEQEREHVCDDMVLAHSPHPHIYARALTRLAELSAYHNNRLTMQIARQEKGLLFRIKRIVQPSKSHIMEKSIKRRSYQLASLIVASTLLVFLTIDVNGNSSHTEPSQKGKNQPAATETAGTYTEENAGIYVIDEKADMKVFGKYINSIAVTPEDLEQHDRKISQREPDAIDPAQIKYKLMTISSGENGEEKSVTLLKLTGTENKTAADSPAVQDPRPIYIILEENMFNSSTQSPEEYKTAFSKGQQVQDLNNIEPDQIASIHVLKGSQAIEVGGEAAKDGVIFVTLKKNTPDTTAKGAVTIKSTKEDGPAAKAVTITTNHELKGTRAQPLYILLEAGSLGDDPGPAAYMDAIASGRQLDDPQSIDPTTIAAMHVVKDASTTSLGEAAKNGLVFITLKASESLSHELTGKVDDHFAVFPNPANELVKISFVNKSQQHVTAEVLDPDGNKIHTLTDGILNKGSHELEWQSGGQPAGIYTILLKRGREVKTTKLILE